MVDHGDVYTRATALANIRCPTCGRYFNQKAAQRHIEYCEQKSKLIGIHQRPFNTKMSPAIKEPAALTNSAIEPPQAGRPLATKMLGRVESRYAQQNLSPKRQHAFPKKNIAIASPPRKIDRAQVQARVNTWRTSPRASVNNQKTKEIMSKYGVGIGKPRSSIQAYKPSEVPYATQHIQKYNVKLLDGTGAAQHAAPLAQAPSNSADKPAFISKFCTNCGYKYVDTTHRFCGDCGRPRATVPQ